MSVLNNLKTDTVVPDVGTHEMLNGQFNCHIFVKKIYYVCFFLMGLNGILKESNQERKYIRNSVRK